MLGRPRPAPRVGVGISVVSSGSDSPKRCFHVTVPSALLPPAAHGDSGFEHISLLPATGTGSHLTEGFLLPAIKNVNAMQSFDKLSATLKLGFKSRESTAVPESHCFQPKAMQGSVYIFLGFVFCLSSSSFTCCLVCMLFAHTFST